MEKKANLFCIFAHFQGDINARPGSSEDADFFVGIFFWDSVLVAVYSTSWEGVHASDSRDLTNAVVTIAQNDCVKNIRLRYFGI